MSKRKNKPIVAVVGRPNVGKSTLFNVLAGRQISITEDTPGVTRDRIYADCSWLNYDFTLIDTGGIEPDSGDIIDMLRRAHKPVVLCVNKTDNPTKQIADVYEFYNLGIGEPFPISAANRTGIGDMLDEVVKGFKEGSGEEEEDEAIYVAVVGKPNVGKSSIVNRLIGENRLIVSDIAGTTRDAIDTRVKHDGKEYVFIDTAGLRRKNKIKENLERYMIVRTVGAVERADITILVIDAKEGITEQDAKIAGIAHERGKAVIVAVNKWDLIEKDNHSVKKFTDKIHQVLSFLSYAEIIFISAETGQRLVKLYDEIDLVSANQNMRIQTGVLNEIINEACVMQQPPSDKGHMLKIMYSTQVAVKPPTFVLFVNSKELMHFSYLRYLENRIRDAFGFRGTPLKFIVRERGENKK